MLHLMLFHRKRIYFDSIEDDSITHLYKWVIIDYATSQKREKGERRMKKVLPFIIALLMIISTLPMLTPSVKAMVYNYSITDITQSAPDTIVVSAQCLFCSACNPNDPNWPDRGTGCTPFGCGYPPASFPSYVPCQQGSPNGRYAAIRLTGSFGSVTQKLVCDQSNWPLNTLWSHNFVFGGLTLQSGETITIEADFYCSYCYHWYAIPQTFVPQKYTIVFVPFHWDASANVAKPRFVSRSRWGCPDGESSPRWAPEYLPVTHVIIHHTDTTNSAVDWANEVYNIWDYHTNTRGWGDIGYNYLIDPNGVIYEGRAGGDDVIAAHAAVEPGASVKRLPGHSANPQPATDETNYNDGSMGIAFLGSFSGTEPSEAALRSATALIAWKCAQRNIDPLGNGPDNDGIEYPYISGHRDVGYTTCPGDRLYSLLGTLRQSVSNTITQLLGSNLPKFETGFFAEVKKQEKLIIDNVGILTNTNTEVISVGDNIIFPDHTYWNWLKLPPGWETIQFSETDDDQAQRYMQIHGWSYMVTFASNHGATGDRYVAITNKDIWNQGGENVDGFSASIPCTTVIAQSSTASEGGDYTVLHELGHSWGLLDEYSYNYWFNEASSYYLYDGYGVWLLTHHPPNSYPGDDTPGSGRSNGRSFDSKRCIMGPADPWTRGRGFCPAHTWDDPNRIELGAPRVYEGCFAHVDESINRDTGISSVGLVSAIISFYRDKSVAPTIQEITGLRVIGKPLQYLGTGDYSINVFSENGDQIYSSNITLSFATVLSQHLPGLDQNIFSDIVTVHWFAPMFSESEVTVVLKDNVKNEIITSQVVTISPMTDAWIDYKTTDKEVYDFGEDIEVMTEVNTKYSSIDIVLDITLLDPNNVAQDYRSWRGTIYPAADPITLYMSIPSSGLAGKWTVYAALLDNAGQFQDSKRDLVTIGADSIPPITTLVFGSPEYTNGMGNIYVTSATPFTLDATDNGGTGSGVAATSYRIHNTTYSKDWITSLPPIDFQITGLDDGNYDIDYNSTDYAGNVESTKTQPIILDNTPPLLTIETPSQSAAIQDGVDFKVSAWDLSAVASVTFSIQCAQGNVISSEFESMPATLGSDGKWHLYFDTRRLPDGFYLFAANGTDVLGNWGTTTVPFSIQNWAAIQMLPSTPNSKAGRTMPIKFSIRVKASVDPAQPFIYNEELTIKIYKIASPSNILLQTSTFGSGSTNYRIDTGTKYITNFKTQSAPATYLVNIYRKGMLIGSFQFSTVK